MRTSHKLAAAVAVLPLSLLLIRMTGSAYWLIGLPLSVAASMLFANDLHGELMRATDLKTWSARRVLLQLPQYIFAVACVFCGVAGLVWLLWALWHGGEVGLKEGLILAAACVIAIPGGISVFLAGIRGAPPSVKEWFEVSFDDTDVHIDAHPPREPAFEASFPWASIERVIFQDGGIEGSDIFFIFTHDADRAFVVLTEGRGGPEFSGALCERGYFPAEIFMKAMGSVDGGRYVWPPDKSVD